MKSENGKTLLTVNFETSATGDSCSGCEYLGINAIGLDRSFWCSLFRGSLESSLEGADFRPIRCRACAKAEFLADQTMGPGDS